LTVNPINLIALNIPSYMGGIRNMWDKSKTTIPIKHGSKISDHEKQDFSDGKIEFLSFEGKVTFGVFERIFTGGGKRITQGEGPFLISFYEKEKSGALITTYIQVDGEYLRINSPMYMQIALCADLPNGQINTLFRKPLANKFEDNAEIELEIVDAAKSQDK